VNKKTVMVVDDTKDMVWTVKKVLKSDGYNTMEAGGGLECLQKLYESREKPDLILLDVMMQPMDGWVTLKTIKADKKLSSIPVSMMTVIPPTPDIIEGELLMMFENYITKPFTKTELLNKLHETFEQMDKINSKYDALINKKAGKVADEYKHLATEFLRRKRVVEAMKKCSSTKLKSGKPIDEVIKNQEELIWIMEQKIAAIEHRYGI